MVLDKKVLYLYGLLKKLKYRYIFVPAEHLHCAMTFFNPLVLFWRDRTQCYLEDILTLGVLRKVVGTATPWSKMSLYLFSGFALWLQWPWHVYHFHTIWWSLVPGEWGHCHWSTCHQFLILIPLSKYFRYVLVWSWSKLNFNWACSAFSYMTKSMMRFQ